MANVKSEFLTDEQVEEEIIRLRSSEYVKLARREQSIRYKQRQYLYTLRVLEKKGIALAAQGYTLENIGEMMMCEEEEEN